MTRPRVCVAGGGAAGFFAAVQCKCAFREAVVLVLEKSRELLAELVISGDALCIVLVTDSCLTIAQCLLDEAVRAGVKIQTFNGLRAERWMTPAHVLG